MANTCGLGGTVASHYNNLKDSNLRQRTFSRIYFMRNFNNWIKSLLIGDAMDMMKHVDALNVLDLASGKGGDLLKWRKYRNIRNIVFTDIASTSVEQSRERYRKGYNMSFKAQFITLDSTKDFLKDSLSNTEMKFDITSCQFALHYGFESYAQARMLLHNACELLNPGGYFIGTIPNDLEIMRRLKGCPDQRKRFGNDVYSIEFKRDVEPEKRLFGIEYLFNLEGVVDCPEFLVHFPLLVRLAEEFNMELVYRKSFDDFFNEKIKDNKNIEFLKFTKSLEPYPAMGNMKMSSSDSDSYKRAKESDADNHKIYGTLSIEEWEAIS